MTIEEIKAKFAEVGDKSNLCPDDFDMVALPTNECEEGCMCEECWNKAVDKLFEEVE